jgi:hypothetical protein
LQSNAAKCFANANKDPFFLLSKDIPFPPPKLKFPSNASQYDHHGLVTGSTNAIIIRFSPSLPLSHPRTMDISLQKIDFKEFDPMLAGIAPR